MTSEATRLSGRGSSVSLAISPRPAVKDGDLRFVVEVDRPLSKKPVCSPAKPPALSSLSPTYMILRLEYLCNIEAAVAGDTTGPLILGSPADVSAIEVGRVGVLESAQDCLLLDAAEDGRK